MDTGIWYEVDVLSDPNTTDWVMFDTEGARLTRPEADKLAATLLVAGQQTRVVRVTHSREVLL